jgi:uncharacterized RDD family membrane protein YckC
MPAGPDAFPRTGVNSLASYESRAFARLLDASLLGIPYFFVVLVIAAVSTDTTAQTEPVEWTGPLWLTVFGPLIALFVVYETVCVTLWGQTLGKLALGVRVARQVNGRCPLWWQSFLRVGIVGVVLLIPFVPVLFVASGLYMAAGFDPLHRNVPDRAAGTVVVRTR